MERRTDRLALSALQRSVLKRPAFARSALALPAVVLALALAACERAEKASDKLRSEASDAVHAADRGLEGAAELFRGKREDAQATLEQRIDELGTRLDAFTRRARERGETDRDRLLRELEVQRDALKVELAELRAASEERWRELCRGAERRSDELAARCRALVEREP